MIRRILIVFCLFFSLGIADGHARTVVYNTKTRVWHTETCLYSRCKNCKKIEQDAARRRGGRACHVCGG